MDEIRKTLEEVGLDPAKIDHLFELLESGDLSDPRLFRLDKFILSVSAERQELYQLFLDHHCVTFGDVVLMIQRGIFSKELLERIVNFRDGKYDTMPGIIVIAARKRLAEN